jgi:hypothetical protein
MAEQSIRFQHLPLTRVMFLSDDVVVGCGYDFNLLLFTMDHNGYWYVFIMPFLQLQIIVF